MLGAEEELCCTTRSYSPASSNPATTGCRSTPSRSAPPPLGSTRSVPQLADELVLVARDDFPVVVRELSPALAGFALSPAPGCPRGAFLLTGASNLVPSP